ncbi:MAG: hypothetical protein K0S12_149 [Bacteroidetes bacterium]|jgi:hypothetical protein|nr:hypothetical protein [Bacteroidota bacterium]
MKPQVSFIVAFLLLFATVNSQTRVIKPVKKPQPKVTNLAVSGGITRSVLYLNRNVKENNEATGYSFALIYGGAKISRVSVEYTHYKSIDIRPTWLDIRASTIEANIHVLARFKKTKAFFYPLGGISYNMFSGYFTGKNDFLNLSERYKINSNVSTNWVGINIGTGYEHYIKKISLFADYKMRVGLSEGNNLNIMDVCFSFGIRYNLRVPSVYKIFSGTRSRYLLDTEEAED